jgi:phosphatidate phosphatase PAH1
MRKLVALIVPVLAVLAGCAADSAAVTTDPTEATSEVSGRRLPDIRCSGSPDTGAAGRWRHIGSYLSSHAGAPRHRGIDLVTSATAESQTIQGEISYGIEDKALEDEWVEVYACRSGAWVHVGNALTDDEGRFALTLSGGARLPVGQRDVFISVFGDRSSTRALAMVVPDGRALAVSDVDGTLTESENAFPESLVTGADVAAQPGAAAALRTLAARGYPIVYLTARGRYFTADTRDWLAANGFPRGALRLADSIVTLPGSATVDYKTQSMRDLGLPVSIGIGNRASDVEAYTNVGVSSDRIFIHLPEFSDELQGPLGDGDAVGVTDYNDVLDTFAQL